MKKFFAVLAVLALVGISTAALAAEITVGGEVAVRSRDFSNLDMYDNSVAPDTTSARDTQTRMKIDVNAKAGDVKGKIQLWSDFDTWGTDIKDNETQPTGGIAFREAWISFPLPVIPVTVTAGHQLLTVGNGWFLRSQHYGQDAWVVSNTTGPNTAAVVNIKFKENDSEQADDKDAYTVLDMFKINDDMTVGADFTMVRDRTNKAVLVTGYVDSMMNIGANFNGKLGPVNLKAEVDLQAGKRDLPAGSDPKFKGNQVVLQAAAAVGPVTINGTLARGSGETAGTDIKGYQTAMDIDPHYTFLYEYKIPGATGAVHTGFANTTAIGLGASFAATKTLSVGADVWHLIATEDTNVTQTGAGAGALSDKLGLEVDLKVNWQVADNLKWNWTAGMFMPGDAYKDINGHGDDTATGIQGILSFAF